LSPTRSAFAGFCFPPEVIVLAVRWYLRFALSYRDIEELLAERGIEVDHTTVYRWVQRFTPLLAEAARPCRHAVGDRWQVDETYTKVAGRWRCIYRAIDQFGQVIDVFVSVQWDTRAARRFFERAIGTTKVIPVDIVTDHAPGRCCSWRCVASTSSTLVPKRHDRPSRSTALGSSRRGLDGKRSTQGLVTAVRADATVTQHVRLHHPWVLHAAPTGRRVAAQLP
jgi:transposase-like protein